jgi:hypothetical protein
VFKRKEIALSETVVAAIEALKLAFEVHVATRVVFHNEMDIRLGGYHENGRTLSIRAWLGNPADEGMLVETDLEMVVSAGQWLPRPSILRFSQGHFHLHVRWEVRVGYNPYSRKVVAIISSDGSTKSWVGCGYAPGERWEEPLY